MEGGKRREGSYISYVRKDGGGEESVYVSTHNPPPKLFPQSSHLIALMHHVTVM